MVDSRECILFDENSDIGDHSAYALETKDSLAHLLSYRPYFIPKDASVLWVRKARLHEGHYVDSYMKSFTLDVSDFVREAVLFHRVSGRIGRISGYMYSSEPSKAESGPSSVSFVSSLAQMKGV